MVSFRSGGEQRPRAGEFVRAADEQDRDGGTGTREGDAEVARGGIAVDHRLVGQALAHRATSTRAERVRPPPDRRTTSSAAAGLATSPVATRNHASPASVPSPSE